MNTIKSITLCLTLIFIFSEFSYTQCFTERHNTSLDGTWVSCQRNDNPNSARGRSHWIVYELDERKTITSFKLWNINHPEGITSGAKTIVIDYKNQDGDWIEHSTHSVDAAQGSAFYEGDDLNLSSEFVTDQILITITENHGGDCFGLAEVKIGVKSTSTSTEDISADHFKIEISPNPFNEMTSVTVGDLESKTVNYEVLNNIGQIVSSDEVSTQNGVAKFQISGSQLPSGTYLSLIHI